MKLTPAELFGERLREIRHRRNLSQVELSERVDIQQGRISEIERGARLPNVETILRLAVALDCKPTDLFSVFNRSDLASILQR